MKKRPDETAWLSLIVGSCFGGIVALIVAVMAAFRLKEIEQEPDPDHVQEPGE